MWLAFFTLDVLALGEEEGLSADVLHVMLG